MNLKNRFGPVAEGFYSTLKLLNPTKFKSRVSHDQAKGTVPLQSVNVGGSFLKKYSA